MSCNRYSMPFFPECFLAKDFEATLASAETWLVITSIQLHDSENCKELISFETFSAGLSDSVL